MFKTQTQIIQDSLRKRKYIKYYNEQESKNEDELENDAPEQKNNAPEQKNNEDELENDDKNDAQKPKQQIRQDAIFMSDLIAQNVNFYKEVFEETYNQCVQTFVQYTNPYRYQNNKMVFMEFWQAARTGGTQFVLDESNKTGELYAREIAPQLSALFAGKITSILQYATDLIIHDQYQQLDYVKEYQLSKKETPDNELNNENDTEQEEPTSGVPNSAVVVPYKSQPDGENMQLSKTKSKRGPSIKDKQKGYTSEDFLFNNKEYFYNENIVSSLIRPITSFVRNFKMNQMLHITKMFKKQGVGGVLGTLRISVNSDVQIDTSYREKVWNILQKEVFNKTEFKSAYTKIITEVEQNIGKNNNIKNVVNIILEQNQENINKYIQEISKVKEMIASQDGEFVKNSVEIAAKFNKRLKGQSIVRRIVPEVVKRAVSPDVEEYYNIISGNLSGDQNVGRSDDAALAKIKKEHKEKNKKDKKWNDALTILTAYKWAKSNQVFSKKGDLDAQVKAVKKELQQKQQQNPSKETERAINVISQVQKGSKEQKKEALNALTNNQDTEGA